MRAVSPPEPIAQRLTESERTEPPFCISQFALNGRSEVMRERMLADVYILGRIALLGQFTMIYAPPNAGKTLITIALLIEAIKVQTISGHNILYINADDNYKGLVEKLAIAEEHGFLMLAPGENGYKSSLTESHLLQMAQEGSAHGKVVVLDTTKKFADIMDKRACTAFAKVIRGFVQSGGTVILLAHVNKNRNAEGHVIPAGTADLIEDADCAYILDASSQGHGEYLATFENIKSRGDVEQSVSYGYTRQFGRGYAALLESVRQVSEKDVQFIAKSKKLGDLVRENAEPIQVLMDVMASGISLKTEIIKAAVERSHFGRDRFRQVLAQHKGTNIADGHRWEEFKGEKHSLCYRLLPLYANSNGGGEGAANTANTAVDLVGPQIKTKESDELVLSKDAGSANGADIAYTAYTALYVDEPQTTVIGLSQ